MKVKLVAVAEDQFAQLITSAAAAGKLPDVIGPAAVRRCRSLASDELLDTGHGPGGRRRARHRTPSPPRARADQGRAEALPCPATAGRQLLVYRKDLFDRAGLAAPDDVRRVADGGPDAEPSRSSASRWPPRRATRSPSRPSSTSPWRTAASSSTTAGRSRSTRRVRADVRPLRRAGEELLRQGQPGRRLHPGDLLRRPGGHDALVVLPAGRAGRAARRRAAELPAVQGGPGLPGQEQRSGHRAPGPDGRAALFGEVVSFAARPTARRSRVHEFHRST